VYTGVSNVPPHPEVQSTGIMKTEMGTGWVRGRETERMFMTA
jgi:hypothetical protein